MVEAGQLRCWIGGVPDREYMTPAAPGTHFMIVESYKMHPNEAPPRRWTCFMEGQVKWFYTTEIEKHSEVVSD